MMAIATANAASGEASSVVVGLAKCADCTRKNMKAEAAFKGLQVSIKCKNSNGDYESKAVGELDGSGAFSVPLTTDLHDADCLAQLHSAAGKPCPGQEPSRIVPQSESNFVVVSGKANNPSAECASVTICGPIKKHFFDHVHKKLMPPKPKPEPEPKPQPEYHPPMPTYGSPTPTYGSPTPIYHPSARHLFDKKHFFDHFHKDHDHHHFLDHFHKKPVPPKPKPEPKPQPEYHPPTPTYGSPTPTYGSPTPIYHPPARHLFDKLLDHFHKDHDHHHFFDHFHKKPVLPKPEPKPQPQYHPPTPTYGSPTPIYHPPAKHLFDKKHGLDHFHKDHEHHYFDHFHKKPVPPKPKPEPKPQPEYQPPTPTYGSPTPTYGSPTPIYHPPAKH
ncbi:hypothetical protein BAE44_0004393 [Dichanthelium oligosanthes]|uniref:Proline-rich protein 2 n=1 Tax=Dichanthelium oligosanthes TaxID=888268 RepID=A0A1E5WBI1_9POAL|nr:hypothetical protein BAE44_0004393 [Dichanthelium oligosanthes]